MYKEGETQKYLGTDKDYLFLYGMRNAESSTRSEYGDIKTDSRWKNQNWIGVLPIRTWSDMDVWLYILHNNLWIHPKYKQGYGRVGCHIACPFYTKSTWALDKYWYPTAYKRFHNFLDNEFYERNLMCSLNCNIEEYRLCWNGGKFRPEPTEELIKEFAEYKGINFDIAKKYFNKTCFNCENKITKHDVIAMNMKLLGRNIEKFMCKKCLKKYLNISEQQWREKISEFRQQGCQLF